MVDGMNDHKKILIIVGSAPCISEDIGAFASIYPGRLPLYSFDSSTPTGCDVMLIGLDAVDKCLWPAQYFATYHPSDIGPAFDRRLAQGGNTDYKIIAHQPYLDKTGRDLVDLIIPFEPPTGSSALLGVLAGIKMGYEKIIVCGCPLIGKNDEDYDYANFRTGWTAKLDKIKSVTRSMSGWTRELLGEPTQKWMNQGVATPPAGGAYTVEMKS
jgi:hypothetical protein